MIRVAIAVLVAAATTMLVGYYTRLGAVIWTVRPGNGLHDVDLAAGLLAGGVTYLVIRKR